MNVRQIVAKYLKENGFDGLYLDERSQMRGDDKMFASDCCCFLKDPETWTKPDAGFMASLELNCCSDCKPGYRCTRDAMGHKYKSIGPKRPQGELFGEEHD